MWGPHRGGPAEKECEIATFFQDVDGDGFGGSEGEIREECVEEQPAGYVDNADDCDDSLANVNPLAPEECNGRDDNCNNQVDDAPIDGLTYYADQDRDGYGDAKASVQSCTQPSGYVISASDCDDRDADVYPWAEEVCDDVDNDCNGTVDDPDQLDSTLYYTDSDGDGYGDPKTAVDSCRPVPNTVVNGQDCDDTDASISPLGEEECEDGIDQDCDGADKDCTTHWTEPFKWTNTSGQYCGSGGNVYWAYFGETTFDECQSMANLTGTQWYVGESTSYTRGWIGDHDATNATVTSGSWTTESIVARDSIYSCVLGVFDHRTEPTVSPAEQLFTDDAGREWHYWEIVNQTHSQAISFADDIGARIINPNSVGRVGEAWMTAPTHWCHAGAQFNGSSYCNGDNICSFIVGYWE